MKIALIRERKNPPDRRVALTPNQCADIKEKFSDIEVVVESSPDRIFLDTDYQSAGIQVVNDVGDCEILLGIKEVPVDYLIPKKTYSFFSHTIKKQPYNRTMLQEIVKKQITLIDYECLEWSPNMPNGKHGRILGFGHWAGVVGTYNAFLTYGKKYNLFNLKPAYECADYEELKSQLSTIKRLIPNIRIGLTGTGRVGNGALEVLKFMEIEKVDVETYLSKHFDKPVFCNFENHDIYQRINGADLDWDTNHFYKNHHAYQSNFSRFLPHTDVLINGFYWESTLPALFTKKDTAENDFAIKVIADITCDVEGSIPITLRATYPKDPTFGWDPINQRETTPFTDKSIDVMAVTVLPSELPADASRDFGKSIVEEVIPLLINGDEYDILKRATITDSNGLTSKFKYLSDYINVV